MKYLFMFLFFLIPSLSMGFETKEQVIDKIMDSMGSSHVGDFSKMIEGSKVSGRTKGQRQGVIKRFTNDVNIAVRGNLNRMHIKELKRIEELESRTVLKKFKKQKLDQGELMKVMGEKSRKLPASRMQLVKNLDNQIEYTKMMNDFMMVQMKPMIDKLTEGTDAQTKNRMMEQIDKVKDQYIIFLYVHVFKLTDVELKELTNVFSDVVLKRHNREFSRIVLNATSKFYLKMMDSQ